MRWLFFLVLALAWSSIASVQALVCEAQWRDAARNRVVLVRIRMPDSGGKVSARNQPSFASLEGSSTTPLGKAAATLRPSPE